MSKRIRPCSHRGTRGVQAGEYVIYLGGWKYFQPGDLDHFDVLVPLVELDVAFGEPIEMVGEANMPKELPLTLGKTYQLLPLPMVDFQPPPPNWGEVLRERVVPMLASGKKAVFFCAASHGRTGTTYASLISILEPAVKDPILAARERHCFRAVETRGQVEAIRKLRS